VISIEGVKDEGGGSGTEIGLSNQEVRDGGVKEYNRGCKRGGGNKR
jgi:hypothetical protein